MPLVPTRWERVGLKLQRTPDSPAPHGASGTRPTYEEWLARVTAPPKPTRVLWRPRTLSTPPAGGGPRVTPEGLVRARQQAGLSQRDLARELGLQRSAVAEAESGRRPGPRALRRWAASILGADDPDVTTADDQEVQP